jgi:hypothetical protein
MVLVACSTNSQLDSNETNLPIAENDSTAYSLDWKIAPGEMVGYKTAMNQVDNSDPAMTFDFHKLFSDEANLDGLSQALSSLSLPGSGSLISILQRNLHDNITVRMIVDEVNFAENQPDDVMSQLMQGMEGTEQLRGEITPEGTISSFYLENRQRNLLAIFFELPNGTVQVGDTWKLDFNCISMGAGFAADNAEKINQVKFTELTQTSDGKQVAVLDYVLAESVEGNFQLPGSNDTTPESMTCSFIGRGQFIIEEGRWEQLVGEFTLVSTGVMETNAVQHFALSPLEAVPEEYRE